MVFLSINKSWNLYNFREGLIKALIASGYRVVALAPQDDYSNHLRQWGCTLIDLKIQAQGTSPLQDLKLFWRYRSLLKRMRPIAYLSWTIKPNIYGGLASWSSSVPQLANVSGLGSSFLAGGWLAFVTRGLYRLALMRTRSVFFQNADDAQLFLQRDIVRPAQIKLLPGSGVNLQHFTKTPRDLWQGRPFRFVMIARLLCDKGVLEYVSAARQLRQEGLSVVCQYVGVIDADSPAAITSEQIAQWEAEGVISYLGATDDVRPFIVKADCVVLPSYREGTPRALLEAAAMGRPIVATDVPGCRDVVVHGENGFLCDVRSVSSLAQAMRMLMCLSEDQWNAMAEAGRAKMEREFNEQFVIDAYLAELSLISKTQVL